MNTSTIGDSEESFSMEAAEFAYKEGFHAGQYNLYQKTFIGEQTAWESSISKRKRSEEINHDV